MTRNQLVLATTALALTVLLLPRLRSLAETVVGGGFREMISQLDLYPDYHHLTPTATSTRAVIPTRTVTPAPIAVRVFLPMSLRH
jgi:hypothetical protein